MGNFYKKIIIVIVMVSSVAEAQADGQNEPLSFKSWKEQQQVEAQNQVARVSNRIVLLKAGKLKPEDIVVEFNQFADGDSEGPKLTSRAQKISSNDILARLEREQSRTQKSLEFAMDLGLEEYFLGYLNQFQENPGALAQVASRLSKDEVTELLKVLLKANHQNSNSGKADRLRAAFNKSQTNTVIYQ